MDLLYKPKQVSDLLGIPASTLRYYAKLYKDYLSEGVQASQRRRYNGHDLNTLAMVKDLSSDGILIADIKGQLDNADIDDLYIEIETPQPEEVYQDPPQDNQRSIAPIELYDNMLTAMREDHQTALGAKDTALEAKDQYIEHLEAELRRARSPWYSRLFGRDPEG